MEQKRIYLQYSQVICFNKCTFSNLSPWTQDANECTLDLQKTSRVSESIYAKICIYKNYPGPYFSVFLRISLAIVKRFQWGAGHA